MNTQNNAQSNIQNNIQNSIQNNTQNSAQNSPKNKTARGILCTLTGGIMWGFSGTCGQYLFTFKKLDSGWLTVTRMLLAGVVLLIYGFLTQKKAMKGILRDRNDLVRLVIFAIIGLSFCQFTYLTAISYSNAGTATVLQYLGPVLIMIVSCAMAMRLPSGKEAAAIALAVCGTFLLATHGNIRTLVISPRGLFWGLSSAVAMMLYTMMPGRIIGKWGSTAVTGYAMLTGGIFLFFVTKYWTVKVAFDPGTVLGLATIVLIGTALSFTLYLQGVSDIGSVKASMIACVEPVSATVISALWLGTAFTAVDIAGLAAIIVTVLLLTGKDKPHT